MALSDEEVGRLFEIALELKEAGRQEDAELLARLVQNAEGHDRLQIELSDDELNRRRQAAEADIAAGRITPHQEVMARLRLHHSSEVTA